jgi:hypothetical protein
MIKSKELAIALALGLALTIAPATAATKSPTPTPKATVTKKAPVKKVVTATPKPSPKWPPAGFKTDPLRETKLYMKVPTAKEVVGILSTRSALTSQVKACTKFTCGAVFVASEIGCRWWQVNAEVVGATSAENRTLKTFGKVTTSVSKSDPRQIITILLVTTEPIASGQLISNISADCNQGEPTGPIPFTEYKAAS